MTWQDDAWKAYEEDYQKRKNELISKLDTIKMDVHPHKVYRKWIDQVIDFIKEQKG